MIPLPLSIDSIMTIYRKSLYRIACFVSMRVITACAVVLLLLCLTGCGKSAQTLQPIRTLEQLQEYRNAGLLPEKIDRIYCSGGTLRLAVYLECADKVIAVDTNERKSKERSGMKAYLAAHTEFSDLPVGGETSGRDNPETLLGLKSQPQLIIKADTSAGYDPVELTHRTGIPVLLVPMWGLTVGRAEFDSGLRLMAAALKKTERAETVIAFFDKEINEIKERTNKHKGEKPLVYAGGVSYNGSHGFNSTEAGYPPFVIAGAKTPLLENENEPTLGKRHTMLAKEKILEWNPDVLFLDLGTLYLGAASGLEELRTDSAYKTLKAVKNGNVFALMPNTFYFVNHDAVLVNSLYVAKVLYPDLFTDIDAKKKADEIFTFLVGQPVFGLLNGDLQQMALERVPLTKP